MNIPRPEYPRPMMRRDESSWMNLNGKWQFELDLSNSGETRGMWKNDAILRKEITVPFPPESKLSGIEFTDFMARVWYRRTFAVPAGFDSACERLILHFGAVDYFTKVWINEQIVGNHKGGYVPFSFDITRFLKDSDNVVTVSAEDDARSPHQPTGKQSTAYNNYGCVYTRCTGIWQTVWFERVPLTFVKNVRIIPDVAGEKVEADIYLDGCKRIGNLTAAVLYGGAEVSRCSVNMSGNYAHVTLPVKNPQLWDIGEPNLYDLTVTAGEDRVVCYFGMRSVTVEGNKFMLNGRSVFQRLVLDQGYFPDGIYTPEHDSELKDDIIRSMSAGFNGARMHMKIFEPRFIYHADRAGYLLWGEYPCWGVDLYKKENYLAVMPEWMAEIERDFNSPSIIGWCPFNECAPGTDTDIIGETYRLTKTLDPSRPVIDTSGYTHVITDIYDVHDYDQNPDTMRERYKSVAEGSGEYFVNYPDHEKYDGKMPYFVSEFGGTFWDASAHDEAVENPSSEGAWGYGEAPRDTEEFYVRFEKICGVLLDNPGICGFCYTQLTDVMQEKNGLFTFERKPKFDLARLSAALAKKAAIEGESTRPF